MRDYTKQSRAGLFYIHISTNTGPGTYTYMPELLFICGDIYIHIERRGTLLTTMSGASRSRSKTPSLGIIGIRSFPLETHNLNIVIIIHMHTNHVQMAIKSAKHARIK